MKKRGELTRWLLPLFHDAVPVLVGNERLVDAVDHVLAAKYALARHDVVDLVLENLRIRVFLI